ncbi:MAG: zinc-binding alcohol dehydrogenase family protein [Chloroflexota bacterium]
MVTMKAIVVEERGGPEVLQIRHVPRPVVMPGWVLIRVRAFGLNRSEMFTRQGHSPSVTFPRILGIEAVGEVVESPDGRYEPGQKVAAVMGGMGRAYDGGYAEYVALPVEQIMQLDSNLPWEILGAIPEMFLTAFFSLHDGLEIASGQSLLVRGATSSVGMMSVQYAKQLDLTVFGTTRSESKRQALLNAGVDEVVIDTGQIAKEVRKMLPGGVDRVQELVGVKTLLDSMEATAHKGIVCVTGILGGEWSMRDFEPIRQIPSNVRLTAYNSGAIKVGAATDALQAFVVEVERGIYTLPIDKVFTFDQIVEAHHYMESNQANGKLVVLTD